MRLGTIISTEEVHHERNNSQAAAERWLIIGLSCSQCQFGQRIFMSDRINNSKGWISLAELFSFLVQLWIDLNRASCITHSGPNPIKISTKDRINTISSSPTKSNLEVQADALGSVFEWHPKDDEWIYRAVMDVEGHAGVAVQSNGVALDFHRGRAFAAYRPSFEKAPSSRLLTAAIARDHSHMS